MFRQALASAVRLGYLADFEGETTGSTAIVLVGRLVSCERKGGVLGFVGAGCVALIVSGPGGSSLLPASNSPMLRLTFEVCVCVFSIDFAVSFAALFDSGVMCPNMLAVYWLPSRGRR